MEGVWIAPVTAQEMMALLCRFKDNPPSLSTRKSWHLEYLFCNGLFDIDAGKLWKRVQLAWLGRMRRLLIALTTLQPYSPIPILEYKQNIEINVSQFRIFIGYFPKNK